MDKSPGQRYYEIDCASWGYRRADGTTARQWDKASETQKRSYERYVILRARDRRETIEEFLASAQRSRE